MECPAFVVATAGQRWCVPSCSTPFPCNKNSEYTRCRAGLLKPDSSWCVRRKTSSRIVSEAGSATVSATSSTHWEQKTFDLPEFPRGCHIITQHINKAVPEINQFQIGLAHIFLMHTSASLTINENASLDVRLDMEDTLNKIVPEGRQYRHLDEGLDDMPAHVKVSMMGSSLMVPIKSGCLHLGIWQGIWLNEHRNYGGCRRICVTLHGQTRADGRCYL